MNVKQWYGYLAWVMVAAIVLGTGGYATAQNDAENEEQIIQIGPDRDDDVPRPNLGRERRLTRPGFPEIRRPDPPPMPEFWIGLVGGPVMPEVRHHVDIPEGVGLMILEVPPNSPAAEAGLERFDIMLRANDVDLKEMPDLAKIVRTEGERQGQIAIEVLRHGQHETVWVTPGKTPADARSLLPLPAQPPQFGDDGPLGRLFGQLGQRPDGGFEGRHIGPGVIVNGQQLNIAQLPNGVSVKVEKRTDRPTRVTVERDGQKWEIEGDDPEALDQLPEDVRPYVERMLGQGRLSLNLNIDGLDEHLPALQEQFEEWGPMMGEAGMNLFERIQEMEEQMQQMREKLYGPPADDATGDATGDEDAADGVVQ